MNFAVFKGLLMFLNGQAKLIKKCVNRGVKLRKYYCVTTDPMLTGGHLQFVQSPLCVT